MEQHTTNFGARLRSLIDAKGISLAQFAGEFGISESQLHNWLKRAAPPLEKHWPKLAEYFGAMPEYVGFGTSKKSESNNRPTAQMPKLRQPLGTEMVKTAIRSYVETLINAAKDRPDRLEKLAATLKATVPIPLSWMVGELETGIILERCENVPMQERLETYRALAEIMEDPVVRDRLRAMGDDLQEVIKRPASLRNELLAKMQEKEPTLETSERALR